MVNYSHGIQNNQEVKDSKIRDVNEKTQKQTNLLELLPKGPVMKAELTRMVRPKSLAPFIADIAASASSNVSYSISALP